MSGGVEIEQRPGLDNVLVATQAYTPGATVVQEKPLLHVPGLKPSNPLYQPLQVGMLETCRADPKGGALTHCCRCRLVLRLLPNPGLLPAAPDAPLGRPQDPGVCGSRS